MNFKDTYLIMAEEILSNPQRRWSTLSFNNHDRNSVVLFFKYLVKEKILLRPSDFGRNAGSILNDPAKLLDLCVQAFSYSEKRSLNMISNIALNELIERLQHSGREFYCGGFSGVRNELKLVADNHLKIYFTDAADLRSVKFKMLQMDCSCFRSSFGGNVIFIEPIFKKFLKLNSQIENGISIPSDFYTYLSLKVDKNPMSVPQLENFYKKLGGLNGSFLSWLR